MQNPFAALGLENEASVEQIRAAYHMRVKLCHPDGMQDIKAQQAAQEDLVQLNLVYSEAMRLAMHRESCRIVIPEAKHIARQLYDKGHYESALRILSKSTLQDDEWYQLQGDILMKLGEVEAAHASFRTAVRLAPENADYRQRALQAGVLMRKQKTLIGRLGCWAKGVAGRTS